MNRMSLLLGLFSVSACASSVGVNNAADERLILTKKDASDSGMSIQIDYASRTLLFVSRQYSLMECPNTIRPDCIISDVLTFAVPQDAVEGDSWKFNGFEFGWIPFGGDVRHHLCTQLIRSQSPSGEVITFEVSPQGVCTIRFEAVIDGVSFDEIYKRID